jgi:membrane protease YdiL (CAAX protease family)
MNHTDFKTHCLNPKEKIIGTVWLVFQTSFFAMLLQWLNTLLPAPLPQTEINLIFFSVNFTAIAIIFRQYLWAQIKLIPEIFEKIFSITVSGFAVYWALKTLLTQVLFALEPDFTNVNDVAIQNLIAENYAIMFVGTVILAPITEEMLFRGLVFRGLYDHTPGLAWVFSVALFALIHILGYIGAYPFKTLLLCFLQYLPAGICLAAAYRLSGSLLCPILIHALVNLAAMLSLR